MNYTYIIVKKILFSPCTAAPIQDIFRIRSMSISTLTVSWTMELYRNLNRNRLFAWFRMPVYFLRRNLLILHVRIDKKFAIQKNLREFACMLCMKFPSCNKNGELFSEQTARFSYLNLNRKTPTRESRSNIIKFQLMPIFVWKCGFEKQ